MPPASTPALLTAPIGSALYAGLQGSIYRSDDHGASWQLAGTAYKVNLGLVGRETLHQRGWM